MKFIADDGRVFDTMDECEEYERLRVRVTIAMMWHTSITMYDVDGKEVESAFRWNEDTKDYLDDTHDIYCNEAQFIKIDCSADIWEKIKNYFEKEYDTYLPDYEKDVLRCVNDIDWISFNVEVQRLIERWKSVKHVTIMSKRR